MVQGQFGNAIAASDIRSHIEEVPQGSFTEDENQFPADKSENKLCQCPNCGTAFMSRGDLEPHLQLMCGKAQWQCPYCPRTAAVKAHLKQHITHVHTNSALRSKHRKSYIVFK